MEAYEVEERKQAAADALMHYSQFAMVCIGEGVAPSKLRLHLLKELSGMPSSLRKEPPPLPLPPPQEQGSQSTTADRASSSSAAADAAVVDEGPPLARAVYPPFHDVPF